MKTKHARLPIITKREEIPPGYVRLASFMDPGGRQGPAYGRLRRAVRDGQIPAVKFFASGLASECAPTYVDEAAALRFLAGTIEAKHTKPAASLFPAADDRELEPVATVAASLATGDPGTVDRLAASLERVAEALEEILRRSRVELELEPLE